MIPVTVVGAGDSLSRYLTAAAAEPSDSRLRIAHVVDVLPQAAVRRRHPALDACARPPEIHQLPSGTPAELLDLLGNIGADGPVVVATPTPTHLGIAIACLDAGITIGLEKPYVGSVAEAETFDARICGHTDSRLFLFGYYLLEKGLPLLALARSGMVPATYLGELSPSVPTAAWDELRSSLGALRSVAGCIFEGIGAKATLQGREWVLDNRSGGITFDQFYHLVCLALLWCGPDPLEAERLVGIEDVLLLRDPSVLPWGTTAETLTLARLRLGDGTPLVLGAGKYVPPGLHQRWMRLGFERGTVLANFEERVLVVEHHNARAEVGLSRRAPYATQWRLFEDKIRDPLQPNEYRLSYGALRLTERLRDHGLVAGVETRRIEPSHVSGLHYLLDRPASRTALREIVARRVPT